MSRVTSASIKRIQQLTEALAGPSSKVDGLERPCLDVEVGARWEKATVKETTTF